MKKIALSLLSLLAPLYLAHAELFKIPEEDSLASVTYPEGWDVTRGGDSLIALSEDKELMMTMEVHDGDTIEEAVESNFKFLKEQDVSVDKKSQKETNVKINGMDASELSWDGKDESGSCKISMSFIGLDDDHALVILYWASPESEKKFHDELVSILRSIKKVKKK